MTSLNIKIEDRPTTEMRVERFSIEPIPRHLRRRGALEQFRVIFMGNANAYMIAVGGLAVSAGGLPPLYAVIAMIVGQLCAALALAAIAQAGVDYGLPGQVALRASFGLLGTRTLTSPYRLVMSCYFFGAQALAAAFVVRAVGQAAFDFTMPLIPLALALGAVHAGVALSGAWAINHVSRLVIPATAVFLVVMMGIFLSAPVQSVEMEQTLGGSPERMFSWTAFALFVSILWAGGLSNATNISDLSRYTRSNRAMRVGIVLGATVSTGVATGIGAFAVASAGGTHDPFAAIVDRNAKDGLLLLFGISIIIQSIGINALNLYFAGLSLANIVPRFGRVWATGFAGCAALALTSIPSVVTSADAWLGYLGAMSSALTGVILADYVIVKRRIIRTQDLYRRGGAYEYWHGVNLAAVLSVCIGALVYASVPEGFVRAGWGVASAGIAYVLAWWIVRRIRASGGALSPV